MTLQATEVLSVCKCTFMVCLCSKVRLLGYHSELHDVITVFGAATLASWVHTTETIMVVQMMCLKTRLVRMRWLLLRIQPKECTYVRTYVYTHWTIQGRVWHTYMKGPQRSTSHFHAPERWESFQEIHRWMRTKNFMNGMNCVVYVHRYSMHACLGFQKLPCCSRASLHVYASCPQLTYTHMHCASNPSEVTQMHIQNTYIHIRTLPMNEWTAAVLLLQA